MPTDSGESQARGVHPRATLHSQCPRVHSPAARKHCKFARWPRLPRPDSRLPSADRASREDYHAGGLIPIPGRLARCLVQYPPRPEWSFALSRSCSLGSLPQLDLEPSRRIPSAATMRPIRVVSRSDAATSCRGRAPTQVGPRLSDADSEWASHLDRPAPSNGRAGLFPTVLLSHFCS